MNLAKGNILNCFLVILVVRNIFIKFCNLIIIELFIKIENDRIYLKDVFEGNDYLRFFDHRFIGIWVLPIALTGIVFEILLIAPTNNSFPFN